MKGEKLYLVLEVLDGHGTGMTIDELTAGELLTSRDVGNAKFAGHIDAHDVGGVRRYAITRDGKTKLAELRRRKAAEEAGEEAGEDLDAAPNDRSVDERPPEPAAAAPAYDPTPTPAARARAIRRGMTSVHATVALPVHEVDIDAAHRTLHGAPVPPIRSAAEVLAMLPADAVDSVTESTAPPRIARGRDGFLCALFSDGVLFLRSGGAELELPLEHTRALMHYLEHTLQAAAVVAAGGAGHV